MAQAADFQMIHGRDMWYRVAHENTVWDVTDDSVQLAWIEEDNESQTEAEIQPLIGLAFDRWCRFYFYNVEAGEVQKLLWQDRSQQENATALFADNQNDYGEFSPIDDGLNAKQGESSILLCCDSDGRLFIVDNQKRILFIFDLLENRLLRRLTLDFEVRAVASEGLTVYLSIVKDEQLLLATLTAHLPLRFYSLPVGVKSADALAVDANTIYLVDQRGNDNAEIVLLKLPQTEQQDNELQEIDGFAVPFASDIVFTEPGIGVIARAPDQVFLRFQLLAGSRTELPPLSARKYKGNGITVSPDGQVFYWTDKGLLAALPARSKREQNGRLISFRLDSGDFQTRWGRIFIDACIPKGTQVKIQCFTADDIPEGEKIALNAPLNSDVYELPSPELSPPLPAKKLLTDLDPQNTLFERKQGNEFVWDCDEDAYKTFEAPVIASAGRYLWVVLDLYGKTYYSPRIKSLRAQYPAEDLLRRLPRIFSQDPPVADFLHRYLAITSGGLNELDLHASQRHHLLDPEITPSAALNWLASLVGLDVDARWPEKAKREILKNIMWLYRFRGTVEGLRRFINIYLDLYDEEHPERGALIIEHFKVRGLGGSFVGESDALEANSVLGSGMRIGGKVGSKASTSIGETSIVDAIESHAHRFTVIVPVLMNQEQKAVIERILDQHRPAHTAYDICSVDAGMRIGTGLHLGMTSIVGLSSAFGQLQVGASVIGRTDIIGKPRVATSVGNSSLSRDSRVG